jgi:hypothetical protein
VPHTNIAAGEYPHDTGGCNESGTWWFENSTTNNYISGDTSGPPCAWPAGGPGFVLVKILNTSTPKRIRLEARDPTTAIRTHPTLGPMVLQKDLVP